jgi:hypothetical protein
MIPQKGDFVFSRSDGTGVVYNVQEKITKGPNRMIKGQKRRNN